jgi:hypothetical protein
VTTAAATNHQNDWASAMPTAATTPSDRGGEVHRPPPHGIREATRRQLEGEGHETADGEGRRRLGDGQPAPGLQQDDDADDEPDRQPAGRREQVEPALGLARSEDCSHLDGALSRSSA